MADKKQWICTVCGQSVKRNKNGRARRHHRLVFVLDSLTCAGNSGMKKQWCPGSRKHPKKAEDYYSG